MKTEDIARICHEANRAYCVTLGDTSQPPWDVAPAWQKESAIAGVEAILSGECTSPAVSHARWYARKQGEGWVYGRTKDVDLKTHPCMVPYEELPVDQQRKDLLFIAIILALKSS
jgi:hypothetical protein